MNFNRSITFCVLFSHFHLNIANGDLIANAIYEAGYTSQVYSVITRDGWILKFHRILNRHTTAADKNQTHERIVNSKREVVLLVHGLATTGIFWVVGDRETRLSFKLVDAGYDVWLFNSRGTSYTRHQLYAEGSKEYWNYSWHEIGQIDIPTVIDKVLNVTDQKQLSYIGYSQGGATFLVMLSTRPSYNAKISSAHLMVPGVYPKGMTGSLGSIIDSIEGIMEFLKSIGIYGVTGHEPAVKIITNFVCSRIEQTAEFCRNVIFEWNSDGWAVTDKNKVAKLIISVLPDGSSAKQYQHYAQNIVADKFQKYDYGAENLRRYNSKEPPVYNLSRIKVPVSIFYGSRDSFLPVRGIKRLVEELSNVVKVVELPWGHMDFAFGDDAIEKVYEPILQMLYERRQNNTI